MIFGYVLSLAGVLALAVGVLWLTARLKGRGLLPQLDAPMKVVARHAVAPGQSLLVVEMGEEQLLIGAARTGFALLHQRTLPAAPENVFPMILRRAA